jgi:integrase
MFLSKKKSPISQRQLDRLMKHYCRLAGIPPEKAHFHSLKHTCGTYMLSVMKESLVDVKEHMGHKSIASTMVYAQLTAQANDERAMRLRKWK